MPNGDQATKTETEAKTPNGGGFAAPICSPFLYLQYVARIEKLEDALRWALDHCQPNSITEKEMTDYPERFRKALALLKL